MTDTTAQLSVAQKMSVLPIGRMHRRIVLMVGLGLFFDLYEIYLAGTIKPVLTTEFHVSDAFVPLLLGSAFLGMFVGAIVLGRVADRIGRRRAFLVNLSIYAFFSLVSAFSPNAVFLVVTRFLAGLGIGAQQPLADTFFSDVLPAKSRGRLSAWAYTFSFIAVPALGFLAIWLTPLSFVGVAGWRWLFVIGAVGAALVMLGVASVPESPRWLDSVGRHEEASAALDRFVDDQNAARDAFAAHPDEPAGARPPMQRLPLSALTRPPYGRRYLMLLIFHLLQSFGYYGFGTLAATVQVANGYTISQSLLYTALGYLGYPIGSLLSIPLLKWIERKYLLVGSTFVLAGIGVAYGYSRNSVLIVVFGVLFTMLSNVFSNAYHIYQAEIFPTSVRGTATGSAYSLSRLASGLAPFVLLPLLNAAGAGVLFSVIAAILVVVALDVWILGPRTTGRAVEDIAPARVAVRAG